MKHIILLTITTLSFSVFAERDPITRIRNIKCTNPNHSFEIIWDSALTSVGPDKVNIDGKGFTGNVMTSIVDPKTPKMKTYEGAGLKVSFPNLADNKGFKQTAVLNGQSLEFDCSTVNSTKFFRKRAESDAPDAAPLQPRTRGQ